MKKPLNSAILILLSILSCATSVSGQGEQNERKYFWLAWGIGADYYKMDYCNLTDSNIYVLGRPKSQLVVPSVRYNLGLIDRYFLQIGLGGYYKTENGEQPNYRNITVVHSSFKIDALFNCRVFRWKNESIFIQTGSTWNGASIKSQDFDGDTITHFENSMIRQWCWKAAIVYDSKIITTKGGQISIAITVGYNFSLKPARWYLPTAKIEITDEKPLVDLGGFHVGVAMQLWSFKPIRKSPT